MRAVLFLLTAAAFASGCRSDPYAAVREQEWRRLEDEIYCLRGKVYDLEDQLDSCRRENDALRRSERGASETLPAPSGASPEYPPGSPAPEAGDAPDELRPPAVELGPEGSLPPLGRNSPPRSVALASAELPAPDRGRVAPPAGARAVRLRMIPRLTGGNNTDGRRGDEGIMAVVQPLDAEGSPLASPGPMRVVVHDPRASGNEGPVALWRFTAEEVAARYRKGPLGAGVYFELPWPNRPPARQTLRVEVICEPAGARPISTSQKIAVELPRTASDAAWKPTR